MLNEEVLEEDDDVVRCDYCEDCHAMDEKATAAASVCGRGRMDDTDHSYPTTGYSTKVRSGDAALPQIAKSRTGKVACSSSLKMKHVPRESLEWHTGAAMKNDGVDADIGQNWQ